MDGRTDGRTDGPTTRLQELLRAAKNTVSVSVSQPCKNYKNFFFVSFWRMKHSVYHLSCSISLQYYTLCSYKSNFHYSHMKVIRNRGQVCQVLSWVWYWLILWRQKPKNKAMIRTLPKAEIPDTLKQGDNK